jgi:hypothetical protein
LTTNSVADSGASLYSIWPFLMSIADCGLTSALLPSSE